MAILHLHPPLHLLKIKNVSCCITFKSQSLCGVAAGWFARGLQVASCCSLKRADSAASLRYRMMKRHKWQPTEQHGKDQISHQQPSAHQRLRTLTALTDGRTNRIHHIRAPLRSTILMLLTLSEMEGHSALASVLTERTSQWLRWRIINTSHCYVFLLWRRKAAVLTLFLCIWRRLKANSLQLTYKEKRGEKTPCLSPLKASDNSKDHLTYCVRALTFWGLLHQAASMQHFPPSLKNQ